MVSVDDFYPLSRVMRQKPGGLWQVQMVMEIREHLEAAKRGDRERESRLINRLGQLRRNVSGEYISPVLLSDVIAASRWLSESTGRKVDWGHEDPRYWVTARDGKSPRW